MRTTADIDLPRRRSRIMVAAVCSFALSILGLAGLAILFMLSMVHV
jgi:hypothetical protein